MLYKKKDEEENDDDDGEDEIDDKKIIEEIKDLKDMVENNYQVRFNFDNKFLYYPNFKNGGKFSDLDL